MRVEYRGAVAYPETVEEAARLLRLLTGSSNGHRQTSAPLPVEESEVQAGQTPNITAIIKGLRDPQKAIFTAIIGNNGSMQGTALMETLGITRQALGGLLGGIRHSLEVAGLKSDVLRVRETEDGKEYSIPSRVRADVQEGLRNVT